MSSEQLKQARDALLKAINTSQETTNILRNLINESEREIPSFFEDNKQISDKEKETDRISWSSNYFDNQWARAKENFSRRRIDHLLEIRDHLRDEAIKGFVTDQTNSADTMTSNYEPSENLKMFIEEGNLLTIRTALRMELDNNNLSASELTNALNWAKGNVKDLIEPFSEKSFARGMDSDQENWGVDYYGNQVVYLKTNFSSERFLHLVEVRELLRQQGAEGFITTEEHPETDINQATHAESKSSNKPDNPSYTGQSTSFRKAMTIGGAVALLAVLLITLIG